MKAFILVFALLFCASVEMPSAASSVESYSSYSIRCNFCYGCSAYFTGQTTTNSYGKFMKLYRCGCCSTEFWVIQ